LEKEKMECTGIRKLISSSIDDQLSPDEKEVLSSHIRSCPNCKEALEESQAVHELFASAERISAPYGFTTRIMANLEAEAPSRVWAFFTFRPFFLRAVEVSFALIVVLTGLLFGNLLTADRISPKQPVTIQASFSLDLFQATPPDSIGSLYVTLAETTDEK
jgi:anti-sigma factor RsiW